jgi:hypothetical protein
MLRSYSAARCNALGLHEYSDLLDWTRLQNGLKVRCTCQSAFRARAPAGS